METRYAVLIAAVLGLVVGGVATYTMTDQSDALQEQGETIEALNTSLTETETAFSDYEDGAEDRMRELYDQIDGLEAENEELETELNRYQPTVDADYETDYEVNRTESDQNVDDSFTLTVNEATDEVELDFFYELETDSIDTSSTADSLTVYDGDVEVGNATADENPDAEDGVKANYTLSTTDAIDKFDGEYRVELEQNFDIQDEEQEYSEVVDIPFTVSDNSNHYIYEE